MDLPLYPVLAALAWLTMVILALSIAQRKHRDPLVWTVAAVAFSIFALLILLALPAGDDPAAAATLRECPHCLSRISLRASVCRYCGRDVAPVVTAPPDPFVGNLAREEDMRRSRGRS